MFFNKSTRLLRKFQLVSQEIMVSQDSLELRLPSPNSPVN